MNSGNTMEAERCLEFICDLLMKEIAEAKDRKNLSEVERLKLVGQKILAEYKDFDTRHRFYRANFHL